MLQIWARGLKQFITGTTNGAKHCLDVHVANTVGIAASSYAYKERRVHLPATTNIPGNGSAMIELDVLSGTTGGTAIANTITELALSWNGGGIIEIGVGANAAAAAAATKLATLNEGQTKSFGVSLVAGDKVWVRRVESATAISAGTLVAVFLG